MIIHGPRPKGRIRPEQLPEYEQSNDWIIQRKFNGHKNTIHVFNGKVEFFNKGEPFKRFVMPNSLRQQFSHLKIKGDCWLDGELLDPLVKNTVVLYDVLQWNGKYLLGEKQVERLNLLKEICVQPTQRCEMGVALQVTEGLWLAEAWDKNFVCHFEEFLHLDLIEGLVLRKKLGMLMNFGQSPYEVEDQIRCRKGNRKYRF